MLLSAKRVLERMGRARGVAEVRTERVREWKRVSVLKGEKRWVSRVGGGNWGRELGRSRGYGVKVEKGKAKEKRTPEVPEPHQYVAFYKYAKIKKPEKVCEDLRSRLELLGGLGRIYVSSEGINAQMSLPRPCFDAWLFLLRSICDQHNIGPITMSVGSIASMQTEESRPFSKLTIKLKNRIVQDALPSHIDQALDLSDLSDISVSPHDWHHKMALMSTVNSTSSSSPSPASLSSPLVSDSASHIALESSMASHPPDRTPHHHKSRFFFLPTFPPSFCLPFVFMLLLASSL